MHRLNLSIAIVVVVMLGGCSSDVSPKTYPVKGRVVYKSNQQPLAVGTVLFESASAPPVQASGEIQADGSFELASDLGKPGTVAGEHRVLIQPPILEAGQKPVVQRRFTSYATSGLKAIVEARSRNEVTLEVER